jgi:hypothetical protein
MTAVQTYVRDFRPSTDSGMVPLEAVVSAIKSPLPCNGVHSNSQTVQGVILFDTGAKRYEG